MRKQYILNDMKLYVSYQLEQLKFKNNKQLKEYTIKNMINQLSIKSNGCYYFIKLFVDYVKKDIFNLESDLNLGCTIHGLYLQVFSKLFSDQDKKIQNFYKSIISLVLASPNNQLNKSILNSLFINPSYIDNCLKNLEYFQLIYTTYNEEGDSLINLTNYPIEEWLNDVKLTSRKYFSNVNFGHLLLLKITPNISVNQFCYQIDKSNFSVFDLEHKLIWLLLEIDNQQFNLIDTQTSNSEIAKEICSYRSKLYKNQSFNLDDIYLNLFASNLLYDDLKPQFTSPPFTTSPTNQQPVKSNSLINLTKNKTLTTGISAAEQKVLSTFSKLTLKSIEPDNIDEPKINLDYDIINLMKAIENIDLESVKRILDANPELVNKCGDDDDLPLFSAIRTENKQLVKQLIEFNADVNQTSEYDKQTALMLSTQLNLIDIVLILLENDADVDATNQFEQSAIVYAVLYKSKANLIELLLNWGSKTNYLDLDGKNLLLLSCVNSDSDLEVVRLFVSCGLDLFHQDKFGKSVLHLASVHDNFQVMYLFLT